MRAKKALVFRSKEQSVDLKEGLEDIGLEVKSLPMIELQMIKDRSPLYHTFEKLESFDWLVFTSSNAVKFFFEAANDFGLKFYFYPNLKIATVGEKTKQTLEQLGYRTNFVPIKYTAEVLAENIDDVKNKNILIPRSTIASNQYLDAFEKRKAKVTAIDLYENIFVTYDQKEMEDLMAKNYDYLIFTSGSTFTSFHKNLTNASLTLNDEKIVCIGPSTAEVVNNNNYVVTSIAEQYDTNGIISAVHKLMQNV